MTQTTQHNNIQRYASSDEVAGSEAIIRTLINESVDVIFGYPGGSIISVYDYLFDYLHEIKHVLTRHEQGAIHAAQGYARTTGKAGVVFVTSGPGATNLITGLADAMADSTPLVCISGQVASSVLGTDAFQEADVVGITLPVTKWNYRLTDAKEIPFVLSKAMYVANSGRPGPVMIDISKDAQINKMNYYYEKCNLVSGYKLPEKPALNQLEKAVELINAAEKPFIIFGQGVKIANAHNELSQFIEKSGIPAGWTILGCSALPTSHPLNMGMLGMHGNFVPNKMTQECDLLIAVGMRFDDRVTSDPQKFAPKAKVIHIDIDPSEIDKTIKSYYAIKGNVKSVLPFLTKFIHKKKHNSWVNSFLKERQLEEKKVKNRCYNLDGEDISMTQVVFEINRLTNGDAILAADVGQHQMVVSRYAEISETGNLITSGGLGTMGFGLPSAIGAKMGNPDKDVIAIVGDGGIQMTIQELGTIMQEKLNVKIVILNNQFLGMVRQWQELFFGRRYAFTKMQNPDFPSLAGAYSIQGKRIDKRTDLRKAVEKMMAYEGAYLLEVKVANEENVFPMIPSGMSVDNIILE
ncbi:MAG: biosynthetic-type acetolactate synthase large subunit [Bacteroidales bacterium]